ncbi:MAG: T9SS type A sorting domain-containing protein [Cyclobacteriaceae bacterium]|nr:T9SS type A sorting domain-containing protein [Cyclobacteriaceae bacterium]
MRHVIFFLLISPVAMAQFTYVLHQDVPVIINNDTLKNPWAGGLNAAQFNTIDLNGDNKNDLAVFDRMANRVLTFLNLDNSYVYAPEFEIQFPKEISGFMLLRDFDCDGKQDLFTQDLQGIMVFKNVTMGNEPLSWEPFLFYTGFPGPKSHVLLTKGFSGKINLQLQSDDLPAIVDADGDGDLDIFNVRFVGLSTIEYHKNFSMERYGTCDSLDFERITQNWGGVQECDCGDFVFGTPCPPGGRIKHASGKALLALDIDNDNDMDILYSEGECTRVYQLINVGDNDNPLVTSASPFPSTTPINLVQFPATFYEDINFDGVNDLLASPNIFAREYLQSDLKQSIWMYANTGSSQLPDFSFQKRNFLQEEMIDVGDNAVPAFFDADADGDLDMFIGNYVNGSRASIYYFENKGTRSEPMFNLITDDFNLISLYGFTNIKPQFADMNGDAKIDLVFTASNQFGISTNLYFVPNTSSVGVNFSGQLVQSLSFPIFSSENIHVAYINDDFLPDLLVGKQNGSLQFWQNTGIPETPTFSLINSSYLGYGASVLRQNLSASTADLNSDGKPDLVLGDQTGEITIIDNFKEAIDASNGKRDVVFNSIFQTYTAQNLGGRIWPTIANIFNTNRPTIAIGNILGGIHLLVHDETTPLPEVPQIDIYPNPVFTEASPLINISVDRPAVGYVFSITGQQVGPLLFFQGYQLYQLNVDGLHSGLYVIRFFINGKSYSRRFIVL